ncbi:MAG: pyridoxal phosphate-dependent aminotransferase [Lachnospiraceae bacterium]|jgi:aspartate aminotransferase|nr:pyridoxal phosphate-dependent aminotransferase [Lachnospiraceae bacterium]MCI9305832.1 pyridoxal phosphate-dependent aminotransferase [Lachnospiraceae bacterium]
MISEECYELGSKSSIIREIFSYGLKRKAEVGADKVYDFSLGNPSIPAPESVKKAILELMEQPPEEVHAYSPAPGDARVRGVIAESLNRRFEESFTAENIFMTCGAAASLNICIKALGNPGDTFITFAPFFPEYRCWVEGIGAELEVIPPHLPDFQIDLAALEKAITPKTKGVIVNSPNNPSGVVYTEEVLKGLAGILKKKSEAYGAPIYLITDEPYREIVYGSVTVPYLTKYYDNTLVCYSYSKSLSLPGERIGYIVIPGRLTEYKKISPAIAGAARVLGFVCAPALFQQVAAKCVEDTGDIEAYRSNRDLLLEGLTRLGYRCVPPQGAFYLFVEALEEDANAFCERAKKYDLLLVPSDDFGWPGYVRIAYCVAEKTIVNAMPAFEKLMEEYR